MPTNKIDYTFYWKFWRQDRTLTVPSLSMCLTPNSLSETYISLLQFPRSPAILPTSQGMSSQGMFLVCILGFQSNVEAQLHIDWCSRNLHTLLPVPTCRATASLYHLKAPAPRPPATTLPTPQEPLVAPQRPRLPTKTPMAVIDSASGLVSVLASVVLLPWKNIAVLRQVCSQMTQRLFCFLYQQNNLCGAINIELCILLKIMVNIIRTSIQT